MTATKTRKISLNIFDDKRFYVNNIKSYPYDENLYLFKKDLVNKINVALLDLDKDQLTKSILEQTIKDDRELTKASINLYNT